MPVRAPLEATYPGTPAGVGAVRRDVVAFARDCGFGEAQLGDIKLAVSEAASNAVIHAYAVAAGDIRATAALSRGVLVVVIADDGPGMVPRTDSPGLGLGLPMISTVADRLEVRSPGRGCEIEMGFDLG